MLNFFLIAGPNGVGKSSNCRYILPTNCEIIDYDYIYAANYRKLDPSVEKWDKQDVTNAKTIEDIELRKELAFASQKDIAIHSNLYPYEHDMVKEFVDKGYTTNLYFMAADNVEICKHRVLQRAYLGEHNVHVATIEEKYTQGLKNLEQFHKRFDKTIIFDNSQGMLSRVAKFENGKLVEIKSNICASLSKKIDFVFKAVQEKDTQVKKGLNLSSW